MIGDRAFTRYIKHPSTGIAEDGDPLSSWIGQVLFVSNPNHLAQVSCRHIGSLVLPDSYQSTFELADSAAAWARVNQPRPLPASAHNAIPWDRGTSTRMGPFPLILDVNANGTPNPRKIVCKFHVEVNTAGDLYAAITQSADGQSPASGDALASGTVATGTGTVSTSITLTPSLTRQQRAYFSEQWKSRTPSGSNDNTVAILPAYVWFGWLFTDGLTRIQSLTAHEIR